MDVGGSRLARCYYPNIPETIAHIASLPSCHDPCCQLPLPRAKNRNAYISTLTLVTTMLHKSAGVTRTDADRGRRAEKRRVRGNHILSLRGLSEFQLLLSSCSASTTRTGTCNIVSPESRVLLEANNSHKVSIDYMYIFS